MNQVELKFIFDGPKDAAKFLEGFNSDGEDWPSANAGNRTDTHDQPPWNDAQPESDSKASADPWADDDAGSKPATSQRSSQARTDPAIGVLFPAGGGYDRDTPNGKRHWDFGLPDAPECDCGYPAAMVTGYKGDKKWQAYWCPVGFNKEKWRDKCKFSEFA